jgi:hypothetical protein
MVSRLARSLARRGASPLGPVGDAGSLVKPWIPEGQDSYLSIKRGSGKQLEYHERSSPYSFTGFGEASSLSLAMTVWRVTRNAVLHREIFIIPINKIKNQLQKYLMSKGDRIYRDT